MATNLYPNVRNTITLNGFNNFLDKLLRIEITYKIMILNYNHLFAHKNIPITGQNAKSKYDSCKLYKTRSL